MTQRKTVLLLIALLVGLLLRAPFLVSKHREGDEHDTRALIAQLARGKYSLRDAPKIAQDKRRSAYVDAPLYHHPPLYAAVGWVATLVASERGPYLITLLASLAVLASIYLTGTLLSDPTTGFVAVLIALLCPITQLVSGKIWAEALLSALLMAVIYLSYAAAAANVTPSKRRLLAAFGLGCAITLTRQTGVFAFAFLVPALWCLGASRAVRPMLLATAAGLVIGLAAWFAFTAWRTGYVIPPQTLRAGPDGKIPGFVAMLQRRNPWSFLYLPLLLCPLYAFAVIGLRTAREARGLIPLLLFALGYAVGLSLLAATTQVTYHMKYLAPAMPALAIAAACGLVPIARRSPWAGALIGSAAVCYAAPMLYQLTIELPQMAEVDPRFFYAVFDALPW